MNWLIVVGCFTLLGILFTSQVWIDYAYARHPITWARALIIALSEWYIWALLTPLVSWLATRFRLERGRWLRSLPLHLAVCVALAVATLQGQVAIGALTTGVRGPMPFLQLYLNLLTYWAIVGVTYWLAHYRDIGRRLAALLNDVASSRPIERLAIKGSGRVSFVRVDEIDWIEAAGHYLCLHSGRQSHLFRDTIKSLESRLDPRRFVRVHRSAIVNVDRIKEILGSFQGESVIVLRDGTRVTSSRAGSHRIQQLLRLR